MEKKFYPWNIVVGSNNCPHRIERSGKCMIKTGDADTGCYRERCPLRLRDGSKLVKND